MTETPDEPVADDPEPDEPDWDADDLPSTADPGVVTDPKEEP